MAYRLIVVRAQSGLVRAEGKALKTGLFTGKGYGRSKYVREQLNEICEGHPECFAIDSRFITSSMERQFDDTVMAVTGCSRFYLDGLAQAFIDKGVSAYFPCDCRADLGCVDKAIAYRSEQLCVG